jgi:Mn-dependent DtxR family transcriptional regulator
MLHKVEVTPRQYDCLEFIREYNAEYGKLPSQPMIARAIHSPQSSIFMMFQRLIDKGVIHRDRLWCREYSVVRDYCLKT